MGQALSQRAGGGTEPPLCQLQSHTLGPGKQSPQIVLLHQCYTAWEGGHRPKVLHEHNPLELGNASLSSSGKWVPSQWRMESTWYSVGPDTQSILLLFPLGMSGLSFIWSPAVVISRRLTTLRQPSLALATHTLGSAYTATFWYASG